MSGRQPISQRLRGLFEDRLALLLALLISGDLLFIILYVLSRIYRFTDMTPFRLDIEGSHPEFYQYIKLLWIVLLLIHLAVITRGKGYISWILVFLYFLADDSLQFHERTGRFLGELITFQPPFGLLAKDAGELIAFALFGIPLLALLIWTYHRGSPTFKRISKDLLLLVVVFAFFVVVFDLAHAILEPNLGRTVNRILTLIEDGGEMVIVSIITWYVFRVAFHRGYPPTFLLGEPGEGSEPAGTGR